MTVLCKWGSSVHYAIGNIFAPFCLFCLFWLQQQLRWKTRGASVDICRLTNFGTNLEKTEFQWNRGASCTLRPGAGLPDGMFSNENPKLGKFWRVLQWKILAYFMSLWYILRLIGMFYCYLVYFMVIWYIFPVLVCCSKKNLSTLARSQTYGREVQHSGISVRVLKLCSHFSECKHCDEL
jgi:hypothetical protein